MRAYDDAGAGEPSLPDSGSWSEQGAPGPLPGAPGGASPPWMTPRERAVLNRVLNGYHPREDFPTGGALNQDIAFAKHLPDYLVNAVMLMRDDRARAEHADLNSRYDMVSRLLFTGAYHEGRTSRLKKAVFKLLAMTA